MNCESCGKPLSGGAMSGLWKCENEKCLARAQEFTMKPEQRAYHKPRAPYKRRAA